jgi:hypothetical protein
MEHHILQALGKEVTVHVENVQDGHSIAIVEGDVRTEYIIKGFAANYQSKRIRVDFGLLNKRITGELLGSERGFYEVTDPAEFTYFYQVPVSEILGTTIAKHCLNGLLFRKFGVRCFAVDGSFYQPVTFELEVSNTDITVIPIDGVAPFTFSLNGQGWTNDPLFPGLAYGTHTFLVTDSLGTISTKEIELIEILEQE